MAHRPLKYHSYTLVEKKESRIIMKLVIDSNLELDVFMWILKP